MATLELNKIDEKLNEISSKNLIETNVVNFVDKSDVLFSQMQMIAFNNKMFLKLA